MYYDLTKGKISKNLILFALSMMAGNLMQQFYNIADTLIVGRVVGKNALAAVGSAYTLMTFLTSIFLGLSMGAGVLFSIYKGKNDKHALRVAVAHAFVLIMAVMVFVNVLVYVCMHPILWFLRVPQEVMEEMQQSVMNFGILMVQGLVNSFGATTMAAFAAAVKIDTFAYLPVQDFGNAYSTFVAQNYGVKDYGRIQKGTKEAFAISIVFSIIISILVCTFAASLMEIFVKAQETAVIACGVQYLRIEGSFYCGIGCLFLLYGYYRAINKAQMSVVLTVISLGLRVVLAYILSVPLKAPGIWVAIVNHKNLKEI
jgi:putative efflux protein, MATE family